MVERFNGRVQWEVLGIMIYSHANPEIVLRGFNAAYNSRRQRVLKVFSPEMVLRQRLEADPALANPTYRPPSPNLIKRALRIIADAKEVSHPDSEHYAGGDEELAATAGRASLKRFGVHL